ncbi:MAG: HIT domain-containing protein [Candidatus Aenigmarchaeota archaeon]|nr:HIT domain-containing protein [Candidatus Aenigmarchaeota archaeon]
MEKCIFCKIVEGKVPSYKIYEDRNYIAFLDKFPRTPGHTQVIPKRHYRWVYDVPDFGEYFDVVKKIAEGIKKALNPRLVHLITIGDEVPHAHVWIVPRFENDGHGPLIDLHKTVSLSDEEMSDISKRVASKVS